MPRLFLSYSPPGIPLSTRACHALDILRISLFRLVALLLAHKLKTTTGGLLDEEHSDSFFFDRAAATSAMNSVWYVYTERFMNIAS